MAKIDELDWQSEDIKHHGSTCVLKYNYAIRKQELDIQKQGLNLQWEEHVAKQANTEVKFFREQELKKLVIQLKQEEERAYQRQIELLHLQIQYQHAVRMSLLLSSSQSSASSTSASNLTILLIAESGAFHCC